MEEGGRTDAAESGTPSGRRKRTLLFKFLFGWSYELQQPYTTEEIERRPYAVVISLLIGLLLMLASGAVYIYCTMSSRIDELTDRADAEKTRRIEMYEQLIFFKRRDEAARK